jgi:erythromycin esterase-like protein
MSAAAVMRCLSLGLLLAGCASQRRPPRVPADIGALAQQLLARADIRAARVIGFGETTHGTLEMRRLPLETAMQLATGEAELTIALEIDVARGLWLNEHSRGCGHLGAGSEPSADADDGFSELVRRVRAHRGPGCVRVVGVDAMAGAGAATALQGVGHGCLGDRWRKEHDDRVAELDALAPQFGIADEHAKEILSRFSVERASVGDSHECAMFEHMLAAMGETIAIRPSEKKVAGLSEWVHETDRDAIMARGVELWAKRGKVVFLAHAGHTAAVPIPHVRGSGYETPAGARLRRSLADDYVSVGMHFGTGELSAIGCVASKRFTTRRIPPPKRSSIERDLLRAHDEATVLSASDACEGRNCDATRWFVYCLPRGWNDSKVSYGTIDLRAGFDWFVFFPYARAERYWLPARCRQ